jgi:DNA-binding response OmpR family regulator
MNEYQSERVKVLLFQEPTVMGRILIIDDDRAIQKALRRLFESDGYTVEISGDGKSALEAFRAAVPTAIILDLRLPIVSGREVCREIRRQSSTAAIVVLSAVTEVLEKIALLELGADDYVTKPFSPQELLARVRTAIRHRCKIEARELATFNGICVDFTRREATFDGQAVDLTNQEFKILKFFSQNAERVISREELLTEAFGYKDHPTSRTLDSHIWKLRQKLERDPENPIHFCTIRGVGYKFIP